MIWQHPKRILATRLILALVGVFFTFIAGAQEDQPYLQNRYLFVFSTSAEMKNRIPATQAEINQLLGLSMDGALHSGDSIGIWTFDKTLRVGQFPLVTWQPENAAGTAKAINKFIDQQRYSGTNNFGALIPVLERVIQSSPRLTVLIFCDGRDDISQTPYDNGINPVFKQRFADQKRNRQPFVVVLRAQLGSYAGSSVNFPPGMVNLPVFPPLPKPAPPAPPPQAAVTNAAPAPPAPALPLVVIGTHVETNWQAYHFVMTNVPEKESPPAKPETNSPAPISENLQTNAEINLPLPQTNPAPTNLNSTTNAILSAENPPARNNAALMLAAGFLLGALTLAAIFIFRPRRESGSLISHSMKK